MLQAALKEKVIVEEESLQDYEKRRKDEKVKNWQEKTLQSLSSSSSFICLYVYNKFLKNHTAGC